MSMKFLKTVAGAAVSSLWEKVSGNVVVKDTDASVGIGTDDPDKQVEIKITDSDNTAGLKIVDTTDATATYLGQSANATYLTNNNTYSGSWAADDTGVPVASLLLADGIYLQTNAAGATAGTTRMLIASAGDVTVSTGNLVIGTAGKGIDFSAQTPASGMTAEVLDHYEEGTWTAGFTAGSGTITTNTSYDTMAYTRIGRVVYVQGQAIVGSVSSPSGLLSMTGLPFTSGSFNETADMSSLSFSLIGLTGTINAVQGVVGSGATTIGIREFTGTTYAEMADHMIANTEIIIGGYYMV